MIFVAITALRTGDPNKLIYPRDYNDQYCGTAKNPNTSITSYDLTNRSVLFFFDPTSPDSSVTVCIEQCPNITAAATPSTAICKYDVDTSTLTAATLQSEIDAGNCAAEIYGSTPILDRCVPTEPLPEAFGTLSIGVNNKSVSINSLVDMGRDTATKSVSDIKAAWYYLAAAPFAALLIAFIWLVLMRIFAGLIVWLTVIAANLACIVGAVFLGFYWWSRKRAVDEANSSDGTGATDTQKWEMWGTLIGLIVVGVIALILLIVTLVLVKRIRIAIQIIKEAGRAIWAMPLIAYGTNRPILTIPIPQSPVFWPIFPFILTIALFAYFLWILLYLATPNGPVTIAAFKWHYTDPEVSHKMEWFHLFGFLWSWAFLVGFSQLTLAGAFSLWYWTLDKRRIPSFPVLRSLYRTIRYHLGSIALGSVLIAIVQIIRIALGMFARKAKMTQNKTLAYILACVQCCLKCLEKLIKWINKNAYIEIAIRGRSFCTSASAAFSLLLRNVLRTIAVDWVGDFILFLAKIAITVATGVICYYCLQLQTQQGKLTLQFPFVVAIIAGAEAFVVAQIFMGVYEMGIDTIFLCFLEDDERNDGSVQRPYYMSDSLKAILNKKNVDTRVHPYDQPRYPHQQPPQAHYYDEPQRGHQYNEPPRGQNHYDPQGRQSHYEPHHGQPYYEPQGRQSHHEPQRGQPYYDPQHTQHYYEPQRGQPQRTHQYNEPQRQGTVRQTRGYEY
ncbi:hypothetical protein HDV00_005939 [Rhizophlyctis rosea]|nr:hypothetical protein HDV00_005939 [Rhizophlyctis rosea]